MKCFKIRKLKFSPRKTPRPRLPVSAAQCNYTKLSLKKCRRRGAVQNSAEALFFSCGPHRIALSYLLPHTVSPFMLCLLRPSMLLPAALKGLFFSFHHQIPNCSFLRDSGPRRVASFPVKSHFWGYRGTNIGCSL